MFKATARYIRVQPRKARLAAGLVRNLSVQEAEEQLGFSQLKAGRCLKKVLNSAVANAELHENIKRENLSIIEVRVDAGPVYKRSKSKSRGGRSPILKRTSHLTVIVGEKER
ncbi:50S ribosomal protein L22,50S ribosomal protein L22,ribosomal protein L22,Ribosomal protein L22p/L17e [Chlamydia serpentis]|uniref:Large ribosomal subunit protein uL22 n=1 Tax=Chlamydia serpentis TaxID=1967782 RepID=A0A2R8FBQ8_9CHLA|nr:50S ribosomal protein L22 [Chlamydia serpentis]SPN73762.1 50S ribosomal protein L22,50S ribosomal protein L22,ribosomal protein L22,Ribosomal protein L22p/L17e [Chlamydia serpentis]